MPTRERTTLRAFVARHRIRISAELVDHNPHFTDDDDSHGWLRTATHWRCVLWVGRRRFTTYYSQGPALTTEPAVGDVLSCLAEGAATVEGARSFEDWAREMDCDPDSRRAERAYRASIRQTKQLARWLGPDRYAELLLNMERG